MEIDSTPDPVTSAQEFADRGAASSSITRDPFPSESSMSFDYLHGLNDKMDASSSSHIRIGSINIGRVDDSKAVDRPFNLNERFVTIMDQLDARVEKFRREAVALQDKKDFLLMSMDLIKSHEMLQNVTESEREEIMYYIQRVNARLCTVDLSVRTVRDNSQEDSLNQINLLIDNMIKIGDPVLSRQCCQKYLNACCSTMDTGSNLSTLREVPSEMDAGPIDKKFECALLGCTLDDQKNIKKRLHALMNYLNKQTVSS